MPILRTTAYGHASAGKDLVLSMNATGRAVLGANNAGIAGVFIELRPNQKASVLISKVLIMRQSAADACTTGHPVICAGSADRLRMPELMMMVQVWC